MLCSANDLRYSCWAWLSTGSAGVCQIIWLGMIHDSALITFMTGLYWTALHLNQEVADKSSSTA